ncbi:MAG TPA: DUF4038 domain-containing protein [Methylomirabilota bacterium]|nr:DUF4038 domain-containing protein [Methylomirabilota bacterium]
MDSLIFRRELRRFFILFGLLAVLDFSPPIQAATRSKKVPVVPKWGRLDQSFKSSVKYTNALQQATLQVSFISPDGRTNQVEGFWDGGKTWRVRFCPDVAGRWAYRTSCSDSANKGLHDHFGEFLCTSVTGPTRFNQHGPVRLAHDRRHFEHADGTSFFWLADTVWAGPRVCQPKDWEYYAGTRGLQQFTVAQWAVAPGMDSKKQSAWTGNPSAIAINPEFFQRLDARIDMLGRAGILSAIAPLMEMESQTNSPLPEPQAALLLRYARARWGADPVAWMLAFDSDSQAKKIGRWKRIGVMAFPADDSGAPVVLYPGETPLLLNEFRDQAWVDAFAYPAVTDLTEDALKLAVAGPFANEWRQAPAHAIISVAPRENSLGSQSGKRFTAEEIRRALYWGELMTVPAGVTYGAQGVSEWDTTIEPSSDKSKNSRLPLWRKSLFLPGAKQLARFATLFQGIDFWRLRPEPNFVASQPGAEAPGRFIAAAGTEARDLTLVYVPEDRTLEISLDALPGSPAVNWFNPREGQVTPAVAVVGAHSCQLPTPDPGDWVLLMKAGR